MIERSSEEQNESHEQMKEITAGTRGLIAIGIVCSGLLDMVLLICFIISMVRGDDYMNKLKNPLICHTVGYSIIVFYDIIAILSILTLSQICFCLLTCIGIFVLLAIFYEIGITIWTLVVLIMAWDGHATFLYVVMIIQVISIIIPLIRAICCNKRKNEEN